MAWLRVLSIVVGLVSSGVRAEEYFGRFLTELTGTFLDEEEGRPRFALKEPFAFEDPNGLTWEVPAGTIVDGASVPEFLWSIAAPFSGDYLWASVVHDYYCETKIRTSHDTHRSFYYGMLAKKVERWKADAMYLGVDMFGPQWILEAPSARPNLGDPVVLSAARSKMAGMVRTLQWSDGEFIDVTEDGPVPATLTNMQERANFYREALVTGEFLTRPEMMGVVSFWNERIGDKALAVDFEPLKAVPFDVWLASGTPPAWASLVLRPTESPDTAAETWLAIDKMASFIN